MLDIGRREFITLIGGGAVAWPLAAHAQQAARIPRLGVLLFSTPHNEPSMEIARRGLRDLGYVEGQNLVIEYRYTEGRPERLPALAADLVRLKPDVVFSLGGDVTPAAVKATQTIPIVFTSSADPVQLGFVASLARAGRNATGVTFLLDELASKRLEILKQAAPRISRGHGLSFPDRGQVIFPSCAARAALKASLELARIGFPTTAVGLTIRGSEAAAGLAATPPKKQRVSLRAMLPSDGVVGRCKQIAFDLGISDITVKVHRSNLMRKLNVRSLLELGRMADELKLLTEMPYAPKRDCGAGQV